MLRNTFNLRNMSCTTEQLNAMFDFLDDHKDLARGHLRSADGRLRAKRLWQDLTTLLNSLGGSVKTTQQWQKVTEGGVTRRVARAMEVLHASAPGARVRVMRAAYHSTSGPGVPAASFMLHSSRRVISSGFNLLESPTFPTKPLEISSTPLESSPESNTEAENYKVTEPDDMDISEPSKWRGTTSGNSIRMPSEESSSTDNASIIDLDLRHKGLNRKYSYDSENSDFHSFKRNSTRASPLLDAPVTLSTLKYKSLLNSSNDWNNRRKSYSFEDTSPLNETMVQSNDTLAMESSTDSGICKSSEIMNEYAESTRSKQFTKKEKNNIIHRDDPIDKWQYKTRPNSLYKLKSQTEYDTVVEDPFEKHVALKSKGRLTINVPITVEGEDDEIETEKNYVNDDGDRKVKKVEFCKTELHFAAESGRVNIIATDEKPPPSYDFRKRRSAFVPISNRFEKPITLFGEKNDLSERPQVDEFGVGELANAVEFEENTAATKSILKNKIPKPKPYLLGENMAFGEVRDVNQSLDSPVPIGVSLINKELETKRIFHNKETSYNCTNITEKNFSNSLRTRNKGPSKDSNFKNEKQYPESKKLIVLHSEQKPSNGDSIRHKLNVLQMTPTQNPKTRQLRDSDLTYFGIANHQNANENEKYVEHITNRTRNDFSDTFESVRLIKQISNSAQNSEAESDDIPEYQNIPIKHNFAPVPIPRSRAKYNKAGEEIMILKPIMEQANDISKTSQETRRSRTRNQDEPFSCTNRSLSEPAKYHECDNTSQRFTEKRTSNTRKEAAVQRIKEEIENKTRNKKNNIGNKHNNISLETDHEVPVYANFDAREKETKFKREKRINEALTSKNCDKNEARKERAKRVNESSDKETDSLQNRQNSTRKISRIHRTEKLSTPENFNSTSHKRKSPHGSQNSTRSVEESNNSFSSKKDHRNKSLQRIKKDGVSLNKVPPGDIKDESLTESPIYKDKDNMKNRTRNSKDVYIKKTESSHSPKNTIQNVSGHRSKNIHTIAEDGADLTRNANNSKNHRPSRRSEYVIKYDDKNGTVSSISKVRAGHSNSRQKHVSKERNQENTKEMRTKSKNSEKTVLRNAARSSESKRKKGR